MATNETTHVGENLKRLAGMHDLSQDQLAALLGLSRQGVNNIMKGRSNPSMTTVFSAARFFGITTDELLGDTRVCLIAAAQAYDDAPVSNRDKTNRKVA